jgi:hypothetical protein
LLAGGGTIDDVDLVEELLGMAKEPDRFTRADLGEMVLVAATEIIKLRENAKMPTRRLRQNLASLFLPHSMI